MISSLDYRYIIIFSNLYKSTLSRDCEDFTGFYDPSLIFRIFPRVNNVRNYINEPKIILLKTSKF